MTVEEILLLCGKIGAVCAIAILYVDSIIGIVKKRNVKLSIASLAFLTAATALFVVSTFIVKEGIVSTILSVLAIVFLFAYLVCNIITVFGNYKRNKANRKLTDDESNVDQFADVKKDESGADRNGEDN